MSPYVDTSPRTPAPHTRPVRQGTTRSRSRSRSTRTTRPSTTTLRRSPGRSPGPTRPGFTEDTDADSDDSEAASADSEVSLAHSDEEDAERVPTVPLVHVYTYGYCHRQGQRGSRAAYSVHFARRPYDHPDQLGRLVSIEAYRQTAHVASLLAVKAVLTHPHLKRARYADTQLVVHVDDPYVMSMITSKGRELARQGWSARRPNLSLVRDIYEVRRALGNRVRCVLATRPKDKDGLNAYRDVRRHAWNIIDHARNASLKDGGERERFAPQLGCTYENRTYLQVPPEDRAYALSKGAWVDEVDGRFYTYGDQDLGCHYDMRRTDYINLMRLYH